MENRGKTVERGVGKGRQQRRDASPRAMPDIPIDISISEETNFCAATTTRTRAATATTTTAATVTRTTTAPTTTTTREKNYNNNARRQASKSFLPVSHLNLGNYRPYSSLFAFPFAFFPRTWGGEVGKLQY